VRLLTPPGVAGVAVVSVGPGERAALWPCLGTRGGAPLPDSPCLVPRIAILVLDGVVTDEVLVVDRDDGRCELHTHGAPAVLAALHRRFGFELAPLPDDPGERLLLEALSPEQLDLALEQQRMPLRAYLQDVLALPMPERLAALRASRDRSRAALAMVHPARLVLSGAQNAGKSTIFNRLLFRERVLTGPMPGLTRDPVAERTTLAGYPYEVVDTAGEGPSATDVDREAIEAGRALRTGGLVLLVIDSSREPSPADWELAGQGALVVANKIDLCAAAWPVDMPCHLRISCMDASAASVRQQVGELLRTARQLPKAGPVGGSAALDLGQLAQLDALRTSTEA
jgi:small GTP-binding protein